MSELRRLSTFLGRRENRRPLHPLLNEKSKIPRNFKKLKEILEQYGIFYDISKKIAIVSKQNYGDFIINLIDGTVKLTPPICLKCLDLIHCNKSQRKLCIIGDSDGWANFEFSKIDMLILSKIFAFLFDLLPNHILKQIRGKSHCFIKESNSLIFNEFNIQEFDGVPHITLTDTSLFTRAPPIQGPIPPPQHPPINLRFKTSSKQVKSSHTSHNILELKNAMIKELKHLKKHMGFSKKFSKTSKIF
ncbi:MAG: hypothetical protein ACFFD2_30865 [Promethearchaeota archaeon]